MIFPPGAASFHAAGFYFHCFFSIVTVVGIVLLVAWMIKNLKPEKLLWWAVGLTIVGFIGALITIQYEAGIFKRMGGNFDGNQMNRMMPAYRDVPVDQMYPGMMMKMMDDLTQQNLP